MEDTTMVDRQIMLKLLDVLANYGGHASEKSIHTDINMAATNRVITSPETLEHLNYAAEHGWAEWRAGTLGERQWKITPMGRSAKRDLELGG
jgi:hypothetical protein